jgi:CRP-like cAMP-binding protein
VLDVSRARLFSDLTPNEVSRIGAQFKEVLHPAGREIVVEGHGAIGFMVILDGQVEVRTPDGRTRALGPGDHFGEIGLLSEDTRSATVTTKTDVRLAGMAGWDFRPFLSEHPEVAYRLLQNLSRLVREAEQA